MFEKMKQPCEGIFTQRNMKIIGNQHFKILFTHEKMKQPCKCLAVLIRLAFSQRSMKIISNQHF